MISSYSFSSFSLSYSCLSLVFAFASFLSLYFSLTFFFSSACSFYTQLLPSLSATYLSFPLTVLFTSLLSLPTLPFLLLNLLPCSLQFPFLFPPRFLYSLIFFYYSSQSISFSLFVTHSVFHSSSFPSSFLPLSYFLLFSPVHFFFINFLFLFIHLFLLVLFLLPFCSTFSCFYLPYLFSYSILIPFSLPPSYSSLAYCLFCLIHVFLLLCCIV